MWIATAVSMTLAFVGSLKMPPQDNREFPLWPEGAPGALGKGSDHSPSVTLYQAKNPTGAAVVIAPGGGYWILAPHEGKDYAEFLNLHGVTCFVLRYRLHQHGYAHPTIMNDGLRAIRWVRSHASDFKIDPNRIGMMGSSAGGHLTTTVMTHWTDGDPNSTDVIERVSSRPDLAVLCYAVTTFRGPAHVGSREALLGKNPDPELVDDLSAELRVNSKSPPTFLWHTLEDTGVLPENSTGLATALRKHGVPHELHLFEAGAHGIGLADKAPYRNVHPWATNLIHWLMRRGWARNRQE